MVQLTKMEINQVCSKQLMEHLHLHSDKKIEIAAGGNENEKDEDITITSLKGGFLSLQMKMDQLQSKHLIFL